MEKALSASAQKVQDALIALGYPFTVLEMEQHTRTAQQAADAVGCTLGQIAKSLIFKGLNSGKAILVLTSGVNRVSEADFSSQLHEPIGRADPEFVRAATGFAIGGVPPVAHPQPLETFIDEDLLAYPTIWAAAGTPFAVFELTPTQLIAITAGTVTKVK
jgi:prolyl-tRNA editing enzyme YbaK/EbsC (Cys-tRNA(Pro) deacylase)